MTEPARPGAQGPYPLSGRVAVVCGGSSGIGAATARRLAGAGASVWIGYNAGADRAATLAADLPGKGHRKLHMPLLDSEGLANAAAEVASMHGAVDVLVNSAAYTRAVPHWDLDTLDDALFDRVLTTNVRGVFATIRAFRRLLTASGDAVVVNISSLSAQTGQGSSVAYCASKAALDTMGMSLARALAPTIRVVTVSPAGVATDFVPGRSREQVEKQAASAPLRIVTEPDDVALAVMAAVVNLRQTTGSILTVDAGRHL